MWTPGEQGQTECATYLFTCITVNEIWHQGFKPMPWPSTHRETCCTDNKQTIFGLSHTNQNICSKHFYPNPIQNPSNINIYKIWEHSTDLQWFCNKVSSISRYINLLIPFPSVSHFLLYAVLMTAMRNIGIAKDLSLYMSAFRHGGSTSIVCVSVWESVLKVTGKHTKHTKSACERSVKYSRIKENNGQESKVEWSRAEEKRGEESNLE